MSDKEAQEKIAVNTDREIWRRVPDDHYSPSIHVTVNGDIGINVGGYVLVLPIEEWHRLGYRKPSPEFNNVLEADAHNWDTRELDRPELREALAELEHDQWVKWSMQIAQSENISEDRLERWKKMWVSYDKLPEDVKNQDRVWADKSLALIVPKDKPTIDVFKWFQGWVNHYERTVGDGKAKDVLAWINQQPMGQS